MQGQINQIKKDLNEITNNGKNVKDIFTNNYYVNDSMQDREIIAKEKESNNIAPKPLKPKKLKANKKKSNKIKIDKEAWKKLYDEHKKKQDFDDELPF